MKYEIVYSDDASEDLRDLFNVIAYEYKFPLTAKRYIQGLLDKILSLSKNPETYAIQTRHSLSQYGANVRRINYKKMAIIYTVHYGVVYIHRIVAASTITGL